MLGTPVARKRGPASQHQDTELPGRSRAEEHFSPQRKGLDHEAFGMVLGSSGSTLWRSGAGERDYRTVLDGFAAKAAADAL